MRVYTVIKIAIHIQCVLDLWHFVVTLLSPIRLLSTYSAKLCHHVLMYAKGTFVYVRRMYAVLPDCATFGFIRVVFLGDFLSFIMTPKRELDISNVFMS